MFQSLLNRMARRLFQNLAGSGPARRSLRWPRKAALLLEALEDRCTPSTTVLYVNEYAQGANTGQSWANAYTNLQTALHAAQAGEQIWVAEGTYYPTQGTDRTASFDLKEGVALYGGLAGNETQLGQRDWKDNTTTLSGFLPTGTFADDSYHVVSTPDDLDAKTVLDGFSIVGGNANGPNDSNGGGLFLNSYSTPTLQNLNFLFNSASEDGGAISLGGNATLTNVTCSENAAGDYGGAISISGANPTLTNVTFSFNTASNSDADGGGGALFTEFSDPTITNAVFQGNTAPYGYGGAVYLTESQATFTNVRFTANTAGAGGAVALAFIASLLPGGTFTNATFSGNTAVASTTFSGTTLRGEDGAIFSAGVPVTLTNSILWGNSAPYNPELPASFLCTVSYSDVQGGFAGQGNIDADPLFVNPSGSNFHLQENSPAIDAGTNSSAPAFDLDNNPRPAGASTDMGAYEFQPQATTTSLTSAQGLTTTYSTGSQLIQLTAAVTSTGTVVNEGTVTFALVNPNSNFPAVVLRGIPVNNGQASTTFDTAGLPVGAWSIHGQYVAGDNTFLGSDDAGDDTLTVNPDSTTTTVNFSFSLAEAGYFDQPATFTATVTPGDSIPGGQVNEGTVTFTILDDNGNVVATSSGNPVSDDIATATFDTATMNSLPLGGYSVQAAYVPASEVTPGSSSGPDFSASASSNFTSFALIPYPILNLFGTNSTTTTVSSTGLSANGASSNPFTLSASVTSGGSPVSGGSITFTVLNAASGTVQTLYAVVEGGYASVSDTPTDLPPGSYTIHAAYTPQFDFYTGSSDTTDGTLTVTGQATTTTVSSSVLSATYSANAQTVQVSATVTPSTPLADVAVTSGSVTFTLLDGNLQPVGGNLTVQNGNDGSFQDTLTLPAGTPAGVYSIQAVYTSSASSPFLASAGSTDGTLLVAPAPVAILTPPSPSLVAYSNLTQTIDVSVQVQEVGPVQSVSVNEGTVTFSGLGQTVTVPVTGGTVSVAFPVPAGTNPGEDGITVNYNAAASNPNYMSAGPISGLDLIVQPDQTIITLPAAGLSAPFSTIPQTVSLSASVAPTPVFGLTLAPGTTVNEGTVTFTILDSQGNKVATATSGTVSAGSASASITLPAGLALGQYQVAAIYNPTRGFTPSVAQTDETLAVTPSTTPPGTVWYVNELAQGANTGQSWANAYTSLQSALQVAHAGDQIWVAEGAYTPTSGADQTATFTLDSGVALYGGFLDSTETQLSQRDWAQNPTILSGAIGNTGESNFHVVTASNLGTGTVLDGFTITGGNAAANEPNGLTVGGGLYALDSTLSLNNDRFANNSAAQEGGGLFDDGSNITVANSVFFANQAGQGGAIAEVSGSLTLQNVTIAYNTETPVLDTTGGQLTLTDCIVWGNQSDVGTQVQSLNASYSDLQDGQYGPGNIDADPLFANGPGGDLQLQADSPAIDAGTNTGAPEFDLDENPRPATGGADMGAYEFQQQVTTTSLTSAQGLTTTYSTGSQLIQLTATVTSLGSTVNEGTVTFSVYGLNSPLAIQLPAVPVSNGQASTSFDTAGLPAGTWYISAQYVPSDHAFLGSYDSRSLTVNPDSTTTTVNFSFSLAEAGYFDQPATFTATVTPGASIPGGVVNEGTVTFTILDDNGNVVATSSGNPVSNSIATASFDTATTNSLPPGSYSVQAAYVPAGSDTLLTSNGPDFSASASSNFSGFALTSFPILNLFGANSTTTTVTSTGLSVNGTSFNPFTLTASVTCGGSPVDDGTVTFTVLNAAGNVVQTINSFPVFGGYASGSDTPTDLAPGSYTIHAAYTPQFNFYTGSSDTTDGTLTVTGQATTTTVSSSGLSATYSANAQMVQVSATVTPSTPLADGSAISGTVTFTLLNANHQPVGSLTVQNANGGFFQGTFTLPAGTPTGTYSIHAVYTPSTSSAYLGSVGSTDGTLKVTAVSTYILAPFGITYLDFSNLAQTFDVSVRVSNSPDAGSINEGTVTFSGLGTPVTVPVTGSMASATITVPANTPVNFYGISISYNPAASHGNYLASGPEFFQDVDFQPDQTTTTLPGTGLTTPFSTTRQTVSLSASVTPVPSFENLPVVPGTTVNEGTVTFLVLDGQSNIVASGTSDTVTNGTASANVTLPAGLAIGRYQVVANYPRTSDFANSMAQTDETLLVTAYGSTVASTTPARTRAFSFGPQSLSLSASVKSPSGHVVGAGTVTFDIVDTSGDVVASFPNVPVSAGLARFTVSNFQLPAAGTYSVRPVYVPVSTDLQFGPSSDPVGTSLVVTQDHTVTRLTTAAQSRTFSTASQVVTFSASVLGSVGDKVLEGSVTFTLLDSGNHVVQTVSSSVADGTASAGFDLANLPAGAYHVHATYVPLAGSPDFSASSASADGSLTIARDITTTALTSGNLIETYSTASQKVLLSATVTAGSSNFGGVVNEGTVTFTVHSAGGKVEHLTGNAVSHGYASVLFDLASLPAGSYSIQAAYVPATHPDFRASAASSASTLTVHQDSVLLDLKPAAGSVYFSAASQQLFLIALVTPASGIPGGVVNEGMVTFTLGNGKSVVGNVRAGEATATLSLPGETPVGVSSVHLAYKSALVAPNFSGGNLSSPSDEVLTVVKAPTIQATTTTRVPSIKLSVPFSPVGQQVTLRATVTSPGVTVSEGAVTFLIKDSIGSIVLTSPAIQVSGGSVSTQVTLGADAVGTYQVLAQYTDSGKFSSSSDLRGGTLTITRESTSTTVGSTTSGTVYGAGQKVQVDATVLPGDGGEVNEGTVTFTVRNASNQVFATLANNPVSDGLALALLPSLPAGTYHLHAAYVPMTPGLKTVNGSPTGPDFNASSDASDAVFTVQPDSTTTTVTSTGLTATFGASNQSVTLTASVAGGAGSAVNEGTVTFTVVNAKGQTVAALTGNAVSAGGAHASFNPSKLPVGSYQIHATYVPRTIGADYLASTAAGAGTLQVVAATTPAATSTRPTSVMAFFNGVAESVPLTAEVSSEAGLVEGGTFTFVVTDSKGNQVGQPVTSGPVTDGQAGAVFSLPAGTLPGTYNVLTWYSGSSNFKASSNFTGTLQVEAAQIL